MPAVLLCYYTAAVTKGCCNYGLLCYYTYTHSTYTSNNDTHNKVWLVAMARGQVEVGAALVFVEQARAVLGLPRSVAARALGDASAPIYVIKRSPVGDEPCLWVGLPCPPMCPIATPSARTTLPMGYAGLVWVWKTTTGSCTYSMKQKR